MYKNLKDSGNRVHPFRDHCTEEEEPSWSRPAKGGLFAINVILWLAVCAIIALGVFGIVYSHGMDMTDGKFVLIISAVLVGVGSLGFLICLVGCFSAMAHSRGLIIIYVSTLAFVTFLLLVFLSGVIAGVVMEDNLRNRTEKLMNRTIPQAYDHEHKDLTKIWESVQETFRCCGVRSYRDWSRNSEFQGQNKIPKTCCYKPAQQDCQLATDKESFYSEDTEGCVTSIFMYLKRRAPVVIIALCIAIALSLANVILGSYIACHV